MTTLLQTVDGDIDLSSGNVVIVTNPAQVTAIKLTNRFKFFLGEWFLDKRQGVPYYQHVFVKNPDLPSISQMFTRIILQTPGTDSVLQSSFDFISNQRKLNAAFKVRTIDGAVLEGGLGTPFLVVFNGKGDN